MEAKFHENHSKCETMHPVTHPLADLVMCERCGERMICQSSATQPAQLVCSNYPHCDNQSSPLECVEKAILSSLHHWLENYKTRLDANIHPNKVEALMSRIRSLTRVMKKIKQQIEELQHHLEKETDDQAALQRKLKALTKRKNRSQQAIATYKQQLEKEKKQIQTRNAILPQIKYVLHIYSHLDDPKQKNALLKQVLETCTYRKDRTQTNGELTVKIYPKVEC